ncbi:DUF2339 domain-containing protein [Chitinibacter sp. S2-10]|uniref:DUF2339 domain-containing protein n=1 Tax=Chitinibacter sp. S2-10 TaxID=3373597 RepID=UPI003977D557
MIRTILAVLGLVYGWSIFEFKIGLAFALVGFLVGHWFEKRSANPPQTTPSERPAVLSEFAQLKQRVARLEAEVAQLKAASPMHTIQADAAPSVVADTPVIPATTFAPPPAPPEPLANDPVAATASISPAPEIPNTSSWLEQACLRGKDWLLGGNTVVRLGMLILFIGVSFLLKFAADQQMLPVELRLLGLSLGAAAIFAVGWRLRESRRGYALIMQGGGLGVLYFTIYGAMKLYQLLPTTPAFALLALLGIAAAILAIRQDSSALAVMGISGGFLAPILCSTGAGNHVLLFSYFALLNAGIFGIAWFKSWRSLNLLGFVFTYAIAGLWGVLEYRSELRASTQPFVILFWLFYAGISTLYALKRSHSPSQHSLRSIVDGTLVFGTPIVTLALQSQLMEGIEYGMCYSALIGAMAYFALAAWLYRRGDEALRLFFEAQLAIAVLLATLAIPLAFDGNVTAAMWAIEGAGVVWLSLRQQRQIALAFGLALQFAAGILVLVASDYYTSTPILNGVYLADVLIALSGLFCAWRLQEIPKQEKRGWQVPLKPLSWRPAVGWGLYLWGMSWWAKANFDEIGRFLSGHHIESAQLLVIALTAAVFQQLRAQWRNAQLVAIALGPVLLWMALEQFDRLPHFFTLWGWPIALIAVFGLLFQQDEFGQSQSWQHVVAAWLSWGIFVNETAYLAERHIHSNVWVLATFACITSLALALIKWLPWPVKAHWRAYWVYGTAPTAVLLLLWSWYSALSGGDSRWPLLNSLDLAQIAVFGVLAFWCRQTLIELKPNTRPRWLYALAGVSLFVWLNAMLLRTLHHGSGIEYTFDALRHSTRVQMSLSIFWTVIALALMLVATRRYGRVLWLTGAGLLAVVIAKLFLLDLSHISGIERIGSFIGVGLLLLLIGYLAPLPPGKTDE